MSLFNI